MSERQVPVPKRLVWIKKMWKVIKFCEVCVRGISFKHIEEPVDQRVIREENAPQACRLRCVLCRPHACRTGRPPLQARGPALRHSHPHPRGISPDTRCPLQNTFCTHSSHRRAKRRIALRLHQRDHFSARVRSLVPPVARSCIGVPELISFAPVAQPPLWPRPARLLMCAQVWPASTLPGEAAWQRDAKFSSWSGVVHAVGMRAEPKSRPNEQGSLSSGLR